LFFGEFTPFDTGKTSNAIRKGVSKNNAADLRLRDAA
jgi:hypothetical protein